MLLGFTTDYFLMTISRKIKELIRSQMQHWDLAMNNYRGLQMVKTQRVQLTGGRMIKVQFNPERIRSSAAKVDAKSIQQRACFLCAENRPAQQKGLAFGDDFTILINPYPIFPEHLTIVNNKHTLQQIAPNFRQMLALARELNEFTLFYNGPKCGASAPDHFHFQAGTKGFMPVEEDFRSGKYTHLAAEEKGAKLYQWKDYHCGVITFQGDASQIIVELFERLHRYLHAYHPDEIEPMLNVLAYFEKESWIVHVFPRILHRPLCYFEEGEKQILISPASVDMGGVFITPREEDFEKISAVDLENILEQVCLKPQDTECAIRDMLQM
jgi:hypothetical protein